MTVLVEANRRLPASAGGRGAAGGAGVVDGGIEVMENVSVLVFMTIVM